MPFASQFAGFIFSKFDAENLGFFIDRILPSLDSKDSILDKTFEIISNTMMDNKEILESINGDIKVLDSKDIIAVSLRKVLEVKSVDRINKNISNWLHNKNLPSIESINEISNIAKFSNEYSQIEIANMLKIARTTSILYNKSVEYFGREMSDVLVALFRVISVMEAQRIAFTQMLRDFDSGLNFFYYTIEEEYAKKLSFESHQYLLTILNGFFNASAYIPLLKKYVKQEHHKINANDIDKEYSEKLDYIFGNFISKSMVVIESSFFENIELFLPSRVFSLKENIKLDSKEYFKEALNAFMYQDSKNVPSFDKMAKNDRVNKEFENYYNALQELNILVLPDRPKENTDIEKYLDSIKNIESIYNNDPYIEFIKARFDIQNCEFESATEHYLNALKYGKM